MTDPTPTPASAWAQRALAGALAGDLAGGAAVPVVTLHADRAVVGSTLDAVPREAPFGDLGVGSAAPALVVVADHVPRAAAVAGARRALAADGLVVGLVPGFLAVDEVRAAFEGGGEVVVLAVDAAVGARVRPGPGAPGGLSEAPVAGPPPTGPPAGWLVVAGPDAAARVAASAGPRTALVAVGPGEEGADLVAGTDLEELVALLHGHLARARARLAELDPLIQDRSEAMLAAMARADEAAASCAAAEGALAEARADADRQREQAARMGSALLAARTRAADEAEAAQAERRLLVQALDALDRTQQAANP